MKWDRFKATLKIKLCALSFLNQLHLCHREMRTKLPQKNTPLFLFCFNLLSISQLFIASPQILPAWKDPFYL